jgi:hypothetical protein
MVAGQPGIVDYRLSHRGRSLLSCLDEWLVTLSRKKRDTAVKHASSPAKCRPRSHQVRNSLRPERRMEPRKRRAVRDHGFDGFRFFHGELERALVKQNRNQTISEKGAANVSNRAAHV